jgi:DNA-binding CsgD family transcriptional regulator
LGDHKISNRVRQIFPLWVVATVEYADIQRLPFAVRHAARFISKCSPAGIPAFPATERLWQHAGMSHREMEIFELLCLQMSNKEIANLLGISEATVKFHVSRIFTKVRVRSRRELFSKFDLTSDRPGRQTNALRDPRLSFCACAQCSPEMSHLHGVELRSRRGNT